MGWRKKNEPDYPFVVDDLTSERLGPDGLKDLTVHLWPHECQTCGRPFNGTRAALRVEVGAYVATADLHHPDCCAPRWDDAPGPSSTAATVNFVATTVLLPIIGEQSGAEALRPFLLVNPGLEQVILAEFDEGWRVATTNYYAQYGLTGGGSVLRIDHTVPDAIAHLGEDHTVTVRLGDLRAGWTGDCGPEITAVVRELGGIVVAVSTAIHPALDSIVADFADAISHGQVAGGWVPLS
ncbi:hypothetical protein [Nocardia iowensis]|uniref:Uncharacterized protein n=1 Tax=Nocardia iowensis TaxID=204891 RepID=A0ABX8RZN2_NOCIO|nr:hypothetical protein [Nocardia iowensis]QXN94721.1 hypothetical protein KV110_17725 [Nocardia iowensis]